MSSLQSMTNRLQYLIQANKLITNDIQKQNDNFVTLAGAANDSITNMLHQRNLSSMSDFMAECKKDLPEADQARFQKLIDDNTFTSQWEEVLGKDMAGHLSVVGNFIGSLFMLYGFSQIKAGLSFDMTVGFRYITAITRASALRLAALDAVDEATLARLSTTMNEQVLTQKLIDGQEVTEAQQERLAGLLDEEAETSRLAQIARADSAAADVELTAATDSLEAAYAASRTCMTRGVYGFIAGLVLMGGIYAYGKYQESKEEDKLRTAIGQLASARLYLTMAESSAQDFTSVNTYADDIADAYAKNDGSWKPIMERFIDKLRKFAQPDIQKTYDGLVADDKNATPAQDISADPPTWQDLQKIHDDQLKAASTPPAK
ncbi:hypothetical protein I302_103961 [Kwoniella bestiolae CBS 10118]|uniref:Uncharacterized protein n=1 Tax=Kwoniella bestiolae CBS 10118 TaxID=1296100 RepID=A0A1B9G9V8_9TREE|nr:hypothetical protein I302_02667 [Kwoniella bestiolae CBS 10118]OCF27818.1 hypothetical protein I302_02667 [Kwoniella bestiolae CBS 10118]